MPHVPWPTAGTDSAPEEEGTQEACTVGGFREDKIDENAANSKDARDGAAKMSRARLPLSLAWRAS
jgi:hypothetical protein